MITDNTKIKKNLANRLKTIQGHISGVQRMLEEDKSCEEILFQISAIKSSIHKVNNIFLENYAKDCILGKTENDKIEDNDLNDIIKSIIKYSK